MGDTQASKPERHTVEVHTMEEVIAQLKILLDNCYVVAVTKLPCVLAGDKYMIVYEKRVEVE